MELAGSLSLLVSLPTMLVAFFRYSRDQAFVVLASKRRFVVAMAARVVDLTAHLGLAQSTVSQHLACLKDCGLVTSRPQGRASMFSLAHPEALLGLFAAAEQLLELTGDAVTLCNDHGTRRTAAR